MDSVTFISSVTFGPWRYDRQPGQLFRKEGADRWVPASLGSRAADILAVLLRKPGALVTKDDLMNAVWPGVTVEPNNLTVQIAALRKILDDGVTGPSFIQTVAGRGYRLICQIDALDGPAAAAEQAAETALGSAAVAETPKPSLLRRRWLKIIGAIMAMAIMAVATPALWPSAPPGLPRMSTLVLPFENLGHADDAKIAAALTDDLTSALSLTTFIRVINAKAPQFVDAQRTPIEAIGRKFGARYVVAGSERPLGSILRINAQILSTETGAVLWTDRFDVSLSDPATGQEQAIERLQSGIPTALLPLEAARSQVEHPAKPDALDLRIRAAALGVIPPTPSRSTEIRALYERAMQLEPSSTVDRLMLAGAMLDEEDQNPQGRKSVYERTGSLLSEAQAEQPALWLTALAKLYRVYWQGDRRCREVIDLAEQFLQRYRNVSPRGPNRWLASCQIVRGQADAAVAVMDHALTLEPDSYRSRDYRTLQFALLLLGRYDESIQAGERSLVENPGDVDNERARTSRRLAAAYALMGRLDEATRKLSEALRIEPYFTLRAAALPEHASPTYAAQFARMKEGLRIAGLRDHAEEDTDFGVATDRRLHQEFSGATPFDLPGVTTIRTEPLIRLLADQHPIVIDAVSNFSGPSLPGAIGLRYVGAGGELTDLAQDRLRAKMRELTKGAFDRPVVAVGWNSETFDGRNLALRLVALGYTNVSWYRGGREAWEVRGLPEDDVVPQEW